MPIQLDKELLAYRCELSPEAFRQVIVGLQKGLYPSWTDEELTYHPLDAINFCCAVRYAVRCPELPFDLILRTLVNVRK